MLFSRHYFILLFLSGSLLITEPVFSEDNSALETVIVHARRQENPMSDMSFSADVISEQQLKKISATHANEIFKQVPSTWISRNNGQEQLTAIRSPVYTGAGSCAEFLMLEDGIPIRPVGLCNVNQLFEVNTEQSSSIELIPSSADAFFGAASVHGIINVLTPRISGEDIISQEVGSHDYYRTMVQISEAESYTVAANITSDGGFMDHSGYDQQKATIKWQQEVNDWAVTSAINLSNLNQDTAGYVTGFEAYKDYGKRRDNNDRNAYRDAKSLRYYSKFSNDTATKDESSEWVLTPYFRSSSMEFRMHFLPGDPIEKNKQNSIGLLSHYHFKKGAINLSSGLDLELADISLQQFQDTPSFSLNFPVGEQYNYDVLAWRFSPFTQLSWQFSEKTQITTGLRFETVFYDYENNLSTGSACLPAVDPLNCRYFRPADAKKRYANLSPNIGLTHYFSENTQLFSNLSHGYRAPETSELFRLQQGQYFSDLDSVSSNSLETGVRFQQGNLRFTPSVFYMLKENVIFQDTLRQWVNDAETKHYGVEFATEWQVYDSVLLKAHYTYAKHTYNNNPQLLGTSTPLKGNDIDTAPRNMGGASAEWRFNDNNTLTLQTDYIGHYYTDPENLHSYEGHQLWHFIWQHQFNEQFALNFKIHNLFDKEYAERADYSGFDGDRYFTGINQSFYLRLDYTF